jgi:hypothetical protein
MSAVGVCSSGMQVRDNGNLLAACGGCSNVIANQLFQLWFLFAYASEKEGVRGTLRHTNQCQSMYKSNRLAPVAPEVDLTSLP